MYYFDNAATSYPKPESVSSAVYYSLKKHGGNPGRSSHKLSLDSSFEVFATRSAAANLFGGSVSNTVFTYNATYALNTAIKASYIYGSHILMSDLEHNSVLRPIAALTGNAFASYGFFNSAPELQGDERVHAIISSIRSKLRPLTKTLVCTSRSNVSGISMPIREIGKFCREAGIYFIVDASQSAGFDKLDVEKDYIDALCMPGHKGLYGPMGTGLIVFSEHGVSSRRLSSFIEGGNGFNSLDVSMPHELPEMFEGGTLGVNILSGLKAGIEFVQSIGVERIAEKEIRLIKAAFDGLSLNSRVNIYGYCEDSPILLFNIEGKSPDKSASILNDMGFCLRSGYHCAPLAHKRIGTPVGGAVRLSVGFQNNESEIEHFVKCVSKISS